MLFKQNISLTFLAAGIVFMLLASSAMGQTTLGKSIRTNKIRPVAATTKTKTNFFAIMGEVVQPGVYELNSSTPFLSNLVRISGGLTKSATGHLRIVRQGRPGQQTFFTPSLNIKLLPGDVIVADSKKTGQSSHKVVRFTESKAGGSRRSKSEFIQLGLVNLLKRPVIVKLRREYASLPQVVKFLGQPQETTKNIRVVSSQRRTDVSGVLPNCSLLIFEKPVPYLSKIPDLPGTLNAEKIANSINKKTTDQFAHAGPIGIEEPDPPQSAEIMMKKDEIVGDQKKSSAGPIMLNGPTLSQKEQPDGNEQEEKNADEEAVVLIPPPDKVHDVRTIPEAQSHLMVESDVPVIPSTAPIPPLELIPPNQSMLAETGAENLLPEKTSDLSDLDSIASTMNQGNSSPSEMPKEVIARSESSSNAVSYALGLLLIVGGGIFIWNVAPHKISLKAPQQEEVIIESKSMAAVKEETVIKDENILEAIINDELTIVNEQVILPVSLELYGRPTGLDKLRIDASHDVAKPHFKPSIPQSATQDEASVKASATVAPGVRIDPPINLEGSYEATRTPLVSPASSRNKQTNK